MSNQSYPPIGERRISRIRPAGEPGRNKSTPYHHTIVSQLVESRTVHETDETADGPAHKTVQRPASKQQGVFRTRTIFRGFRTMLALSAAAFLFYACDMPESSSPGVPASPPPYKLTQNEGGTNFTLKIDEGVTVIKAGEYAAVPSIGSGAEKKTLDTKIERQTLGLETDDAVRTAVTAIILPSTLETIEDYAFYGHSAVTSVRIPKTVKSIGARAFSRTGITAVEFADDAQLDIFGASAFDIETIRRIQAPRCTLTRNTDNTTYTLAVAEGVTTVAKGEFSAAASVGSGTPKTALNTRLKESLLGTQPEGAITAITLPSTLEAVEAYAFYGHSAVKGTLTIPDKVHTVQAHAFGSTGTELTLNLKNDSKLSTIGAGAFDIARIKTIRAPRYTLTKNADNATYTLAVAEGVTTVAKGEFSSKESAGGGWDGTPKTTLNRRLKGALLGTDPRYAITAITLPSTLEVIEDYAFYRNDIIQGTLTIPKKVRSIGRDAFSSVFHTERTSPLTLTFEDESQLRTIGKAAFRHRRISALTLPQRLEVIGKGAFSVTPITTASFIIPRNVTRIGVGAFLHLHDTITGTLTIESPHLKRTPDDKAQRKTGALGDNLFVYNDAGAGIGACNFSIIKLHEAVYDSYTQDELTRIFGTGTRGKYQDLDGSALPAKP